MFIIHPYIHTFQAKSEQHISDVMQCDVILDYVILRSPFACTWLKNLNVNIGHFIKSDRVEKKNKYNRTIT